MEKEKRPDQSEESATSVDGEPSTCRTEADGASDGTSEPDFPVVGLGASAGGLEALKAFFSHVPEKSGMAYIVVIHRSPEGPNLIADLIRKTTNLPVTNAGDDQALAPDHVYVAPPDKEITLFNGKIHLLERLGNATALPIDHFFRSLAQDQQRRAVGIILSGMGADGSHGVREIKAIGGLVLVQSEASAKHAAMPKSAIRSGAADKVLPPSEMPQMLCHYFTHAKPPIETDETDETQAEAAEGQREWLNKIFAILRNRSGHDFSAYKTNTILRRVGRRMALNRIDGPDQLETYVRFLRENPDEMEALFREFLIGVTSFFRDPESFEALKTRVLTDLLAKMKPDTPFRAWIPGCATGEEVYSLAILLHECNDGLDTPVKPQLFGTDIDAYAIDKAREGLFPSSIAPDVGEERLRRFFIREGETLRIRKEIRDGVVFSVQDVIKDPPFSRLNLLCCRNLLIYLDAEAQKRLLPLFHYTLKPGGVLMLGASEAIGRFSNLFEMVDQKWKIFRRKEVPPALRQPVCFPKGPSTVGRGGDIAPPFFPPKRSKIAPLAQKAILEQFAPTTVLVDAEGGILHVEGRTGKYIEMSSGPPTQNILDLAREGLRIELSSALRAAGKSDQPVVRHGIDVKTDGDVQRINLRVVPQHAPKEIAGNFMVVFEDIESGPKALEADATEASTWEKSRLADLEHELRTTRRNHQTMIEEMECSNEKLTSTNEELQSANEELQSTNEELESSKEELQSLNEELQTVNAELQGKLEELSAAHDDMRNLLDNTEIATIFLDNDLRIRRFTTEATAIINLIPSDIGRPLNHVANNLVYNGLMEDIRYVLEKLFPIKNEVRANHGGWYDMRIMPYRTTDNRIDGAVITFVSIDDRKAAEAALETAERDMERVRGLAWGLLDMDDAPMLVLDAEGGTVMANAAFRRLFTPDREDVEGIDIFDIGAPESILRDALSRGEDFETEPFEIASPDGDRRLAIRGRPLHADSEAPYRMVLRFIGRE